MSEWIPVSERLPEKGTVVLITNCINHVRCGQFRGLDGRNEEWIWKGNTIEIVSAWMPLPKPYKEQEHE